MAMATAAWAESTQEEALLRSISSGSGSVSPDMLRAAAQSRAMTSTGGSQSPSQPVIPLDKPKETAKPMPPEPPSEFQNLVAQSVGANLPVFGHELFTGDLTTFAPIDRVPVTADYVIGPGDEILLRVWGKVEMDLKTPVDRNGTIYIPEVGNVSVAGVKYQNLNDYLTKAMGRVLRNFELNASLGQLRSIQIFVVGQSRRPGSYTVSSLSTLVNALFVSGGPSSKGSMRQIQVKRSNRVVTTFDLYDLIIKGDKSKDVQLLPGDVIYIPPVGRQVAIAGSVNVAAVFEIKDKSTFSDLLDLAGGVTNVAATQKAFVEQIVDRKTRKVDEVEFDATGMARELHDGDLVRVIAVSPRFDNAVRLQGHVALPMRHMWRKGMRVTDLLSDKNALIPKSYWDRQNKGSLNSTYSKKEVNWDYAVVQRLDEANLTTRLVAFNLGKAVKGDPVENMLLQPGDVVTVFSADEELPKTENDVVLQGSIFTLPKERKDELSNNEKELSKNEKELSKNEKELSKNEKELSKSEKDVAQDGIVTPSKKRFVWREGMRISDLIPNAKWLVDYYDYWSNLKGDKLSVGLNWGYANIVRLQSHDLSRTMLAFDLGKAVREKDEANNLALRPGDEVSIFTNSEIQTPVSSKGIYVRLEGEFKHAGIYKTEPGETLRQLIVRAGGVTPNAYMYGTQFTRESTRSAQQAKIEEIAVRMERDVERNASTKAAAALSPEDVAAAKGAIENQRELIRKVKATRATGRIVLEMDPEQNGVKALPDVALEDGDKITIMATPGMVSVYGAVYNENAFLFKPSKRLSDYLNQAGGPNRDADESNIYVIRADGSVAGKQQSGWFSGLQGASLMPGDAIVVPENFNKVSWMKELKDWTQIIYQLALGGAAIKVLH